MDQTEEELQDLARKIIGAGFTGINPSLDRFILLNTLDGSSDGNLAAIDFEDIDRMIKINGCCGKYVESDWILSTIHLAAKRQKTRAGILPVSLPGISPCQPGDPGPSAGAG